MSEFVCVRGRQSEREELSERGKMSVGEGHLQEGADSVVGIQTGEDDYLFRNIVINRKGH